MEDNNYKLLIVDDIEENLKVIWSIIDNNKIDVSFANSGKQAIKIARKKLPDLILLDINMPEINGYETCKALKNDELTKNIPVIFLSAYSEKENIVKGFDYGAVDYITKPFHKAELLSRVYTHLELKNSKDMVKKQVKELIELNATKDKFFSIIAHDLKSPFNTILGFGKILNDNFDKYDTEKQKKFSGIIFEGIKNTYKLLEDLLLWASAQKGTINFEPEKINLFFLATETIKLLNQIAKNKSIKLINNVAKSIYVNADKNMLSTIIRNLVSNALKFTPKGGDIYISTNEITDKNNQKFIQITIKDNGVGISKEIQSKLFNISENTSTQGTENETGTGLGLILCKEFVKKHDGEIWVESEIGKGSSFCFTIPYKPTGSINKI